MKLKRVLRWLWFDILIHPWPNWFRRSLYGVVLAIFLYCIIGFSIISHPGIILPRDHERENTARQILACEGRGFETPHVYVLSEGKRKIFFQPYRYIRRKIGLEEFLTSFSWPEYNYIVLQENATPADFFHEIGHVVDYQRDPLGYDAKTWVAREIFATDFSMRIAKIFPPCPKQRYTP